MITKTVSVSYSGTVENTDLADACMRVEWEIVDGTRTGNVIVTTAWVVGHDIEEVALTVPAAQLASAKYIDAINASKAALRTKLGL